MAYPKAREDGILFAQVIADELVIYDSERHSYYHLNAAATLVWKRCDGQTSVAQLAQLLEGEAPGGNERLIRQVIQELDTASLLCEPALGTEPELSTRRQFVGFAATVGIPVVAATVVSLAAPTAAHAQSNCSVVACSTPAPTLSGY
jgi:hypothetical protein